MESTIVLTSKKYKTVEELLQAPIKSIIHVSIKEKNEITRKFLYDWLYKNYYSQQKMIGNLTMRIKNISNNPCYYYIIEKYFNNVDILTNGKVIEKILDDKTTTFIKTLHDIEPSITGTFIDYLIRRVICEIKNINFTDNRANNSTQSKITIQKPLENKADELIKLKKHELLEKCKELNIKICLSKNKSDLVKLIVSNSNDDANELNELWKFILNDKFNTWRISKYNVFKSECIGYIEEGDCFIALLKRNEWLKILYKNIIGWIRWKIPNCENFIDINEQHFEFVENIYLIKLGCIDDVSQHYCINGCKYKIEYGGFFRSIPDKIPECKVQLCMFDCYKKTQDTTSYKTKDIILEILITSLFHTEAFNGCPNQDKFNKIYDLLKNIENIIEILINPLFILCNKILCNKVNLLINPSLGYSIDGLNKQIPSDCDLVIDNTLIDIKCTKGDNSIYEILQLLGYASLVRFHPTYNKPIEYLSIINLLNGTITTYNIDYIEKEQLFNYLKLLTDTK